MDSLPFSKPDFVMSRVIMEHRSPPKIDQTKLNINGVEIKMETAPYDPRFPNTNQSLYCWQSYLDYHRCQKVRGSDFEPCKYFQKVYKSICPDTWVERWDGQMESGTFPGNI